MSRTKSREIEIYNHLKENKLSLYSIKSLSVTLDITEEDVKKNLSSLRFGDQVTFEMFGNDTFRVVSLSDYFEQGQIDPQEKHWKKQTKKLIKIYKSQGYSPEECSEISDIELQTVKKYWRLNNGLR